MKYGYSLRYIGYMNVCGINTVQTDSLNRLDLPRGACIVKNYKRIVYRDMVLALFNVIQINVSNMHTITLGN